MAADKTFTRTMGNSETFPVIEAQGFQKISASVDAGTLSVRGNVAKVVDGAGGFINDTPNVYNTNETFTIISVDGRPLDGITFITDGAGVAKILGQI